MLNDSSDTPGNGIGSSDNVAPVRSLPIAEWPAGDRIAWVEARRPRVRLKHGGRASHLKPITQNDLARRCGYFLDFLNRTDMLRADAKPATQITPTSVDRYVAELKARVSSVTLYGSIYKLRRIAQLIAAGLDFSWLVDIENDLALVMEPRSKQDRLVLANVLAEAGFLLMTEAESAAHRPDLFRARQYRDGLMMVLLAHCPIRSKNFAALELGRTFVLLKDSWWIILSTKDTKEKRADERPLGKYLVSWVERYLQQHRPILDRTGQAPQALWLSSNDGRALTENGVARTLSKRTLATVGVNVSPHLFRTSAASTAAIHGGKTPHLATAILNHTDPRIAEEHYNRATSLDAAQTYAAINDTYRRRD
jgi:site-specific recombinase XerD